MFGRLFFAAVLAGLVAGGVMSILQQWRIEPLIAAAEVYETAPHQHDAASAEGAGETAHAGADAEKGAWAPADGLERDLYTVLANILVSIGFTLILGAAAYILGIPLTPANGVVWGLGAFVTFYMAPAFSLPPDLPGMPVADLTARQIWWWGTVIATAAGLLLIARLQNPQAIAIAAVLILAPHVIGAPQPPAGAQSAVPAELASRFAAASFARSAVFWLIAGPLMGYLLNAFARREATA